MNPHPTPQSPEQPEPREQPVEDETSATSEAEGSSTEQTPEEASATALYVRRGRTPTLGFWVALAIGVPAVLGLVLAPILGISVLSQIVQFGLMAAVFVGLPLAALAALIDSLRHRRTDRRRP